MPGIRRDLPPAQPRSPELGPPPELPDGGPYRAPEHLSLKDLRRVADGEMSIEVADHGPAVEELQRALGVKVTGTYDVDTAEAVVNFQVAHGLPSDGIVDADTLFGLNEAFESIGDRFEQVLGGDVKDAFAEIQEAVEEGGGLQAHKHVIVAEELALGVATTRNAVEALGKVGEALRPNALTLAGDVVGVVLIPATAFYATKDVRAALAARRDGDESDIAKERTAAATNRAFGSMGYFASVSASTAKEILKVAGANAGARVAPGLSVVVAVGDVTWATTVLRDKDASVKKKAAASLSALGSLVSMVTPPPISWAASAVATGGLLASNFL